MLKKLFERINPKGSSPETQQIKADANSDTLKVLRKNLPGLPIDKKESNQEKKIGKLYSPEIIENTEYQYNYLPMMEIINEPDCIEKFMKLKNHRANSAFGGMNNDIESFGLKHEFDPKNIITKELWRDSGVFAVYVCAYNDGGEIKYIDCVLNKKTSEQHPFLEITDLKAYFNYRMKDYQKWFREIEDKRIS